MSLSPIHGVTPAGNTNGVSGPLHDTPITVSPAARRAPEPAAAARPTDIEVEKAVSTLNDFTAMVAQDVRFSVDEDSGKTVVKVVDTNTQEVLRQFPSAEALSIA